MASRKAISVGMGVIRAGLVLGVDLAERDVRVLLGGGAGHGGPFMK